MGEAPAKTMDDLTDIQNQLSALNSAIQDLQAQQSTRPTQVTNQTAAYQEPFWLCTYCTGLTLTTGAALDWDPLFNDASASNYMQYRLAAGFGSFDKGNLGFAAQRRWVITWDSPFSGDVKCLIAGTSVYTGDADAAIQVKLNGVMTEYAAGSGPFGNVSQIITLKVKSGRNRLAISADIHPDTVQFCGTLYQNTSAWVDPS